MKAAWLALIFALLSCIIPALERGIARAYPHWGSGWYFEIGNRAPGGSPFFDERIAEKYGLVRGYSVRERVRASINLLGFALCLLAFFVGRAGMKKAGAKKRSISLAAALVAVCASAGYGGVSTSLIFLLIAWVRLQGKNEALAEHINSPAFRVTVEEIMAEKAIIGRIRELKKRRNAVILAHMYQPPEIQDIADHVGDSLGLSRLAAKTPADVILFCGVHFMAETAAILSPEKTVLLPDANAGCPMANMVMPRQLAEYRVKNPETIVVTYVNSSAAVKALSDICCTSANAVEVARSIPEDKKILFVPDRNLGHWVKTKLGRDNIELWNGFCPTHERLLPETVEAAREAHPGAPVVAHPECRPAVLEQADFVASTTGILDFCKKSDKKEFIIATEIGALHPLEKENPGKRFHPLSVTADCPNMKLNSLEKMAWALEDMAPVVTVPEEIRAKALRPIERMLEIG